MTTRYTVTSALPYANGPIHFGHVAGAYLPADIYVRYKRLTGAEVLYVCGTDEHGAPISINAEKEGVAPGEYAARWHEAIKASFERLNIRFDHFSRTSRPIHHETTLAFFAELLKKGVIDSRVEDQLYCEYDRRGLPDRYVVGTCPRCGFEEARGDECPRCTASYDATDLKDPRCKTCGRPASRKPSRHWYLDLPALRAPLERYHAERFPRWREQRPNVVGEVEKYMRDLRARPITRDLSWGIPVPLPEAEGKVFYVWFDAPIGYVSATREWARERGLPDDAWKTWWQEPADPAERGQTRLVHFIGKDNIAFHALIFPAMLLGQEAPYLLPDVPANEFLNLEGRKFNTSSGWFIAIDDCCERYPPDAIRWTLARIAPETRDSEFTWKDFQTRVNTELLGTFANFASRILKFVASKHGGAIPPAQAPLPEPEERALAALRDGAREVGAALEEFSLRAASQRLLEVGYAANKLIEETQPFKTIKDDPARAATTINVACRLLDGLAALLFPFVPATAERIAAQLGLSGSLAERRWEAIGEPADPAGRAIGKPEHLFRRIEDADVAREVAALERAAAASDAESGDAPGTAPAGAKTSEPAAKPVEPAAALPAAPDEPKPEITFEQFMALDLRIARVVTAKPVPKTDKLLELELELAGGERRTVISGIRAWYDPDALVGRQVVYLANLAPRKMRGIVSQGMVLAANDVGGEAILLQPERDAPDGARVS